MTPTNQIRQSATSYYLKLTQRNVLEMDQTQIKGEPIPNLAQHKRHHQAPVTGLSGAEGSTTISTHSFQLNIAIMNWV